MDSNKNFVPYYRVSTHKQGKTGLGMAAQRAKVENYISGKGKLAKEFIEVESGRKNQRVELAKATEFCLKTGAVLVIAKLDRLARSASFIFALRDSGVKFEVPDLPDMNPLTLGIFAGLAQYEAELISERTRDALQALKKKGVKLGNPQNLTKEAREKGYKMRRPKAQESPANVKAHKIARDLREQGLSYAKVAAKLNDYGLQTTKKNQFYATSVKNLLALYA